MALSQYVCASSTRVNDSHFKNNAVATLQTECTQTSNVAQQVAFSTEYNYKFTTSSTDVTFSFEMFDTDKTRSNCLFIAANSVW